MRLTVFFLPPADSGRGSAAAGPQTVICLTTSHLFDHSPPSFWQIADADRLRRAIGNSFERASYPAMADAERRRTLTFVVVGAGPTGIGESRPCSLKGLFHGHRRVQTLQLERLIPPTGIGECRPCSLKGLFSPRA